MLYVTGDTHGEEARFRYTNSVIDTTLTENDKLIICGDFGYISDDSYPERMFLRLMAEKPYQILFVDGNHENFDLIEEYPVEEFCGAKAHIIRRDRDGNPKIVHLMRGQVYTIENKKIFSFGGGYSVDKYMRIPHKSWFPQEMPTDAEKLEAIANLEKNNYKVDYIITHAAPESAMITSRHNHPKEKPLNNFLEWVRENVEYKHWYMGHLHLDWDLPLNQTVLWFKLRNMETNEVIDER